VINDVSWYLKENRILRKIRKNVREEEKLHNFQEQFCNGSGGYRTNVKCFNLLQRDLG
jgi:hypothetical protein